MVPIVFRVWMLIFLASACASESLVVYDSLVISEKSADFAFKPENKIEINGICLPDSIIYAATNQGIIAKCPNDQNWRQLIACEEYADNWHDNITRVEQEDAIYRPENIWAIPIAAKFIIYDNWCCQFYKLDPSKPQNEQFQFLKNPDGKSIIETVNVGKKFALCGLYSINHNRQVGVLNHDLSNYRRIFDIPRQLRHDLDSMGAGYYPVPAYNPIDNTIWVGFRHYNRIYIIDLDGEILDSVAIDAPRFVLPQPPASRIKSPAVFDDWYSKCSSVYSLQYVSSGYFFLQFFGTGPRTDDGSGRPLYSLLWTAEGVSVELKINPRWKSVNIQSGSCLPFVTYDREDSVFNRATLYLTRIEP